MGTSDVFRFKFKLVSCAVVLLSLTGCCGFRRHVGEKALNRVQSATVNFGTIKENRKKEDVITGTLVRVAHYAEESGKRNDAFSALETRYAETLPPVNVNSPSEKELDLLSSKLIATKEKTDKLISHTETLLAETRKDVKVLQEKEIKFSQYEMIACTAGIAILGSLVIQLLFARR